jgi:hypothetical protein
MLWVDLKLVSHYLTKLEYTPEDWYIAPIAEVTLKSTSCSLSTQPICNSWSAWHQHHITALWHSSEWPNWKVRLHWPMALLQPHLLLQHKVKVFTRAFLQKPLRKKHTSPWTNLATNVNLDTNVSWRYHHKCCELLVTRNWVAPVYRARIRGGITNALLYVPSIMRITFFN